MSVQGVETCKDPLIWEVPMTGKELMDVVSRCLDRPLEGLVLRRVVGGRALVHRVSPQEQIDPEGYNEIIALLPLTLAEMLGQMSHR